MNIHLGFIILNHTILDKLFNILNLIKNYYMHLLVCVGLDVGVFTPRHVCGGHRTSYRSWYFYHVFRALDSGHQSDNMHLIL